MNDAARRRVYTSEDADTYSEFYAATARENFNFFRQRVRPGAMWNWFTRDINAHLQQFYTDFKAGKRPKLVISTPPQHGKSWAAEDFIAWVAGNNPHWKTIFASFSADLGMRANVNLQRLFTSERYREIFPWMRIGEQGWVCNTEFIEYSNFPGSFRNTTVQGAVNGMELHLGVLDDPVKGRAEAMSKTNRDKVWAWFTDDWGARFSKDSALLVIMTRWHVDDVIGRLMERLPEVKQLRYPAIDFEDSRRGLSGALFPALKPTSFLDERRRVMTQASWESEYQQNPIIIGGGIIPIDKLVCIPMFNSQIIKKSIRYIDKAGTEDGGAYTAMVLMHELKDGQFVISHVARGQWGALEREDRLKTLAHTDAARFGYNYEVWVEQEPGSGGKESAEATIRNLRGLVAYADKVSGSKEVRAEPFAAQVQNNNVRLVAAEWNYAFLDEAEAWPNGKYRDQIDAAAGAFNKLAGGILYDHEYKGWQ